MQFRIWLEALWGEIHTAAEAARKHPHDWIHFTNLNKLGINPKKSHRDPPGVYFYPCSWIADDDNLVGFQYGLQMKHYYIARLNRNRQGVNLTTIDFAGAKKIAVRNGWWEEYLKVYNDPVKYLTGGPLKNKRRWKNPGAILYATADLMANGTLEGVFPLGKKSWLQSFAGVSYIIDKSAIVAAGEPVQLIAIQPDVMTIIEYGDNKQNDYNHQIAKKVMDKLGGKWWFKNRLVHGAFTHNGKPVELVFELGRVRIQIHYYKSGIKAVSTIRVNGTYDHYPLESDVSNIIHSINSFLNGEEIEDSGQDMPWNFNQMETFINQILPGVSPNSGVSKGAFVMNASKWFMGTGGDVKMVVRNNGMQVDISRHFGDDRTFRYRRRIKPGVQLQSLYNDYLKALQVWIKKSILPGTE